MKSLKRLKQSLLKVSDQEDETKDLVLLSTGSTLLNLACTGRHHGGFIAGKYHLIVGDSASGKSFLSMTCLAEAARSSQFEHYNLVLDDIEGGALFDIPKLFGKTLPQKLIVEHSSTLEEMYYNIDKYLSQDKPFIYVVDSMDSLITEEEEDRFQESKKASQRGKTISGTYGLSKPKMNSQNLRRLMTPLRNTGSILIIICQTRDNIGFGFERRTRAGGRALRFYATLEIWLSTKEKIKKTVKGKPVQIGIRSKIDVKKNRITGREHSIILPLYHSYGIDDIGSCIDFLIDQGHWSKGRNSIHAPEFKDFRGSYDKLVSLIEKEELQGKLQRLVGKVWKEIERESTLDRKPKYL